MSDHLIAEANRHAKALTDERNNLVVELNLLREWQRETIQNERAHHAERKDAIARAERAEAELREWHLLRLWGTTPEIVHDFIKGQQSRIHAAQDIEAELAAEREKVRTLRLACDQICEEWGINHEANPIGAGQRMSTRAGKALEATEDAT